MITVGLNAVSVSLLMVCCSLTGCKPASEASSERDDNGDTTKPARARSVLGHSQQHSNQDTLSEQVEVYTTMLDLEEAKLEAQRKLLGLEAADLGLAGLKAAISADNPRAAIMASKTFGKGEFEEVWGLISEYKGGGREGVFNAMRMEALGRAALVGNAENALEVVSQTFGPGVNRSNYIRNVFRYDSRPLHDLFLASRKFSLEEEQAAIRAGIQDNISSALNLEAIGDAAAINSFPGGQELLLNSLVDHSSHAPYVPAGSGIEEVREERLRDTLNLAIELERDGDVQSGFLTNLLIGTSRAMPFEVFEFMDSHSLPVTSDTLEALLENMAKASPLRALGVALGASFSARTLRDPMVRAIAEDSGAALDWLNAHRPFLDPAQYDQFAVAFAQEAVRHGEIDTAERWLGEIGNDGLRAEVATLIK